ncbi:hypothetical protein O6H91_08G085200 [Diphasiastrum complanatum]|uniref:Uncharacterized protein n=1 Tax=Diphasiastrum complanatum TaxID=34168 RepID=A0ACC2CZS1_DIPCM|nr:hypothetical protein O6H91_08G085200 [Diphasiastrum complanatum]
MAFVQSSRFLCFPSARSASPLPSPPPPPPPVSSNATSIHASNASLFSAAGWNCNLSSSSSSSSSSLVNCPYFPGISLLLHLQCPMPQRSKFRQLVVVNAARAEAQTPQLGTRAPEFELPEPLTGKTWKLEDFEGHPALLVMFICNHCPFVVHLKQDIVMLSKTYIQKGLGVVAISSNSVKTHPQDGPDKMAEDARMYDYPFPYLYDETQDVARAYGARCTPEFFLFKKSGRRPFELVYHGQFDDSRPGNNRPITGLDLRHALDCVLSGRLVNIVHRPSMGCSIKWHPQD